MKIVISPAKSLKWDSNLPTGLGNDVPMFIDEAEKVNKSLKRYSSKKLAHLQGISSALSDLNFERNQNWNINPLIEETRPSVYAFDGDVYRGLAIEEWGVSHVEELNNSLRILSGLYGVLKPFDQILPYRLEMGTKLKIRRSDNLYQFWQPKVASALNDEMEDGEFLVNLASNEYFKAIDIKKLKAPVINVDFKDKGKSGYKVISFYAKKARGLMARYLIENRISDIKEIKNFNAEGYFIDEENSTENKLLFLNDRNN